MKQETIFGYGSLVNAATHDYGALQAATLQGWRRVWHHTSLRKLAFLSAQPDPDSQISGVVLSAPAVDPALENREAAYHRWQVSHQILPDPGQADMISVFAIPKQIHRPAQTGATLLLSYIDVVVQGYFHHAGEAGVQQFFETTHGWDAHILDDRENPQYPRHQRLSKQETALSDHWLDVLAAKVE